MRLYDPISETKTEFEPHNSTNVGMYICGPSPFFSPHIGHARTFVVLDVLKAALDNEGYDVKVIRNVTDFGYPCNEKYRSEAKAQGMHPYAFFEKYIRQFDRSLDALLIDDPYISPRSSSNITAMSDFALRLLDSKSAYVGKQGNAYFKTESSPTYGVLSKKSVKDFASEECHCQGSWEDACDAHHIPLWIRANQENQFQWDSPLGRGFPSSHLECAAMSHHYLGKTIDIHAGGADLLFGHHENILALARALGEDVRQFFHVALVTKNGKKISKGDKDSLPLSDLIHKYGPSAVRHWSLMDHYRSPKEFFEMDLESSAKKIQYWQTIQDQFDGKGKQTNLLPALSEKFVEDVYSDLSDDLNTPKALKTIDSFHSFLHLLTVNGIGSSDNKNEVMSALFKVNSILKVW